MRHARVSAMALMLAALPARAESQSDWWDWTLRDLAVQVRVEIGDGPTRVRGVPDVVYAEPRVAVPRRVEDRYYDRYDDRYEDRYDDRYRGRGRGRGNAPAFCRSGAGHPVHGRRWCIEKGYGLGVTSARAARWERQHWNDVYFGRRWYGARPDYVDGRLLVDVLGRGTYGRLDMMRERMRSRYALTGRWVHPDGRALVLQVRSGGTAIAEFSDLNGDGRVDVVMVARW